jgi:hypothetical protein
MRKRFLAQAGALALTAAAACSCGVDAALFDEFSGSVVTVVDSGPALKSALTFALPDTIVELQQSAGTIQHASDREITASVRAHLVSRGWTDVSRDPGVRPDVLMLVAATTRIQTGVVYTDWYGSWGYLPYWGSSVDASWAWGAPSTAIPYAFPAGTLIIVMLDVRDQRVETRTIPLLWAAAIDGIVTSSIDTAERAIAGVEQAFVQSPYLDIQ